jgi:hypothetical protein
MFFYTGKCIYQKKIYSVIKYHVLTKTNYLVQCFVFSGSYLCPVSSFLKYFEKLNPKQDRLWQKPLSKISGHEAVWYANCPVGKNPIASFMSRMSQEHDLDDTYTNHCARVSAISALNAEYEARHIMALSGHKSETSIRRYSRRTATTTLQGMSSTLASTVGIEEHSTDPPPAKKPALAANTTPDFPDMDYFELTSSQEAVLMQSIPAEEFGSDAPQAKAIQSGSSTQAVPPPAAPEPKLASVLPPAMPVSTMVPAQPANTMVPAQTGIPPGPALPWPMQAMMSSRQVSFNPNINNCVVNINFNCNS